MHCQRLWSNARLATTTGEGLADALRDGIGVTSDRMHRLFDAAEAHWLLAKLHAGHLSNQHGAAFDAPIVKETDRNPGTSLLTSMLLVLNMVEECLLGATRGAARAFGLAKESDLAIWDIERPADLVCRMGFYPLHAHVWSGR